MNKKQATEIVNKCMKVIISCKTQGQLNAAIKYKNLAYKLLAKEVGLINNTTFTQLTERSVGFALCKINKKECK